jgi:hypothetical protein
MRGKRRRKEEDMCRVSFFLSFLFFEVRNVKSLLGLFPRSQTDALNAYASSRAAEYGRGTYSVKQNSWVEVRALIFCEI